MKPRTKKAHHARKPAATLKAVAERVNLTPSTVSHVLTDSPAARSVPQKTKDRILAAARKLNYQPNWVARSLAGRRTFMLGVIVPDLMHSFFAEIAKGISTTICPLGYDVVICNSEEDSAVESSEVDRLLGRQVDGLILASAQPPSATDVFDRIEARGVELSAVDPRPQLLTWVEAWVDGHWLPMCPTLGYYGADAFGE